jgi:hypothetical protein
MRSDGNNSRLRTQLILFFEANQRAKVPLVRSFALSAKVELGVDIFSHFLYPVVRIFMLQVAQLAWIQTGIASARSQPEVLHYRSGGFLAAQTWYLPSL